jgi:hypothetical protein
LCGRSIFVWGFQPWFPIPPVILAYFCGQLTLTGAAAFASRPR